MGESGGSEGSPGRGQGVQTCQHWLNGVTFVSEGCSVRIGHGVFLQGCEGAIALAVPTHERGGFFSSMAHETLYKVCKYGVFVAGARVGVGGPCAPDSPGIFLLVIFVICTSYCYESKNIAINCL